MALTGIGARFSRVQAQLFASTLQRAQLQVKIALAERMDKDLRKLDDKYKDRTGADLEAEVNKLADRKQAVAKAIGNIDKALGKLVDVRTKLYVMRNEATAGNPSTFDVAAGDLNYTTGGSVLYPDNLIGNTGQGSWGEKTQVFSNGGLSATLSYKFLGTDYAIDMADGTRFTPDFENRELRRGGDSIPFTSLNVQSIVGDTITFDDGATTYSGTLRKGGSSVMSSWQYANFATQADKDAAVTDVNAAVKRVDNVERQYREARASLNAILNRYSTTMSEKTKEYKAVTQDVLDAKKAERQAIKAKFDVALNSLSLTSNVSTTFIQNMFLPEDPSEQKGLFDIIMGP